MTMATRAVIVRQAPINDAAKEAKTFVRELADVMAHTVRPRVVLDCTRVRRIDGAFLHLLLCSLEEAMKRNGDVRLAGIPAQAKPALEATGIHRLFRLFSTPEEAVESFQGSNPVSMPLASAPADAGLPLSRAA